MRYKQPYSLYRRRTTRTGRFVWYYRTYDAEGRRTTGRSTGEISKTRAHHVVAELIRKRELVPKRRALFGRYAAAWWRWGECTYLKGQLARGKTVSKSYADTMRSYLDHYVLPTFEKRTMEGIRPTDIEQWMSDLVDRGLSGGTVRGAWACLRLMFNEAERQGLLYQNPVKRVRAVNGGAAEKGILSLDEVKELLAEEALAGLWLGNVLHYTLNLAAASTGLRMGELQALRGCDLREGYIAVEHAWSRDYGLRDPKNRRKRVVPVPGRTAAHLEELRGGPEEYVFSPDGRAPVTHNSVQHFFTRTLRRAGISEQERRERRLSFHSWRHLYNSLLRGRVPEAKLRLLTGHLSEAMTDRYTHVDLQDYQDVTAALNEYF